MSQVINIAKVTRKISLLANMTIENGCAVGEALNAANILLTLHKELVDNGCKYGTEIDLHVASAQNFINAQTVLNEEVLNEQEEEEESLELVDRISRKERAYIFNKTYEYVIRHILTQNQEVSITDLVYGMDKEFCFTGSKNYFLIMFRAKAKTDCRINLRSVRKGGTFASPCMA